MRQVAANNPEHHTGSIRTIGEVVANRHCPTFFKDDYVGIILPMLQEYAIGAAGVVDDNGHLVGLLTERELLRRMFRKSNDSNMTYADLGRYVQGMTVEQAMIAEPETLDNNTNVEDAAGMMIRRGYRFMPVVSRMDRQRLLGIISERELAIALQDRVKELKKDEAAHRSMLSYMLAEPYGCGYSPMEM